MTKPTSHHIYYHTTPYGLRIVHCYIPAAPVAFCGVIVRAGSRDLDRGFRLSLPHHVRKIRNVLRFVPLRYVFFLR